MIVPHRFTPLLPLLILSASATLDPVVIKGSKFFLKTSGSQFFIKGIAYQQAPAEVGASSTNPDYVDPLADGAACARDVPLLQKLGVNTIRTYAIDPAQNHDKCMQLLDAAGIYVISDIAQPKQSIDQRNPTWDGGLYGRYTSVVDALQGYSNVIGFFAGNEVTNDNTTTPASAFVKAAVRDVKAYIKAKGYRSSLAVGYAADDDAFIRANVADYFSCGDPATTIDFWGYNVYSWCGDATYTTSGYVNYTQQFSSSPVPGFLAEYGCNRGKNIATGAQRTWDEVAAIYGPDMSAVFSGGIAYEYFQEKNDYGLVEVKDSSSVQTNDAFNSLSSRLAAATPVSTNSAKYTPTNTARPACPPAAATWLVSPTGLPPTPNQALCTCMTHSLTCAATPNLSGLAISLLFGTVCDFDNGKPCVDIAANTLTGQYGMYSMCSWQEKLSWAFNVYSTDRAGALSCDGWKGNAISVSKSTPIASCASLVGAGVTATGGVGATATGKKNAGGRTFGDTGLGFMGVGVSVYVVGLFLTALGIFMM